MIIGGLGDDILIAGESAGEEGSVDNDGDWVAGGEGNDIIFGSRGRDILMGGSGRDFIEGNGGFVFGNTGFDTIIGSRGDDLLVGGSGQSNIYGGGGDDVLRAEGEAWDYNTFVDSNLFGGHGYDVLIRGHYDNLASSCGPILHGGSGNDTFILNGSSVIVMDGDSTEGSTETDVLWLRRHNLSDVVKIINAEGSLPNGNFTAYHELRLGGDKSVSATVVFGERNWSSLIVRFADDTTMTWLELVEVIGLTKTEADWDGNVITMNGAEHNDIIYSHGGGDYRNPQGERVYGYGGNDLIYDSEYDDLIDGGGNDILHGGLGDDVLTGGSGNDVYVFNIGDGRDVIDNYDL